MYEHELQELVDLMATRDEAAANLGKALANNASLENLKALEHNLEEAQDELDNALCGWERAD